jgi:hypothetical protein
MILQQVQQQVYAKRRDDATRMKTAEEAAEAKKKAEVEAQKVDDAKKKKN